MSELVEKAGDIIAAGRLKWHTNPVMAHAVIRFVLEEMWEEERERKPIDAGALIVRFAEKHGIALDE